MLRTLVSVVVVALLFASVVDALIVPQVISSNMVLQRAPFQARIWGAAAPNSAVKLALDNITTLASTADASGAWLFELPAQDASVGHTIVIAGDGVELTFDNIAFGDVYICSGQSNMEFILPDAFNATEYIEESSDFTNLRLFTVDHAASNSSLNDTVSRFPEPGWQVSQPKYVNGSIWTYFSAACYFFGRDVYLALDSQVPIGLVESCYGGTTIEPWTSPEGLATCGPVIPPPASALALEEKIEGPHGPKQGSVLWFGMIAPLLNVRATGVVWYQGESNAWNATNYACRFPAMIDDWRSQFALPDLYFYFVLLAGYKEGGNPAWAELRAAQLVALDLPGTGVATAQDLGDPASSVGDIHPRYKAEVGERLALLAQYQIYGQDVVPFGPAYESIVWPASGSTQPEIVLKFDTSLASSSGLYVAPTRECWTCCANNGSAIAVVASDKVTYYATVTVSGDGSVIASVDLSSAPSGTQVVSIAYNYVDYPQCTIYNQYGLPHLPFVATNPAVAMKKV